MPDPETYTVRVDVSIDAPYNTGGGTLRVSESLSIPAGSFLELAGILGELLKVAEKLKAAQR
jgi:hypothetical protein